ncbi:MAG TPA: PD-(D/E)XK nuclease family protein, partial [Steroidobacteraceae bacterium]|nr:PD-(D/E)XK nuclease family protein [Steroidobacteraceae bacterium]
NSALGLLWPVVEPGFQARLAEVGAISGEVPPGIPRDPPLRRLPLAWRIPEPQPPRLVSSSKTRTTEQPALEFDWASETARHVGTVVHRELLHLASDGGGRSRSEAAARRRWHDELAELGVPADRRTEAVERVVAAVQRTLADERGRWLLDAAHGAAASEFAITGPIAGEVVSVVIDRTFVDAGGTRWIVDYKTSSHEGAGLEEFLDSEQSRYRPQLERYAELVRRLGPEPVRIGLYFPLLSAWRSWA